MMDCKMIRFRLDDYLDGEITLEEADNIKAHLEQCPDCERRVRRARDLQSQLRQLPVDEPDPEFARRQFQQLWAREPETVRESRWPRFMADPALAAALVIGLVLGGFFMNWQSQQRAEPLEVMTLQTNETREVKFAINANRRMDNVTMTINVPPNMELEGFPGQREITWTTRLEPGMNMLRLPVRASQSGEGLLTMRLSTESGYQKGRTVRLRALVSETSLEWTGGDDGDVT